MCNFKTRIIVRHSSLMFSNLVFSRVFLSVSPWVFPPQGLAILRYLCIRPFCYDLSVLLILVQKSFVSFVSSHLLVFIPSLPTFLKNSLMLSWNALFCLYCLILSLYLLSFPSLANIFWFISVSCIVTSYRLLLFPVFFILLCPCTFFLLVSFVIQFLNFCLVSVAVYQFCRWIALLLSKLDRLVR